MREANEKYAKVIRRLRLCFGISLRELADAAGVSHQYITNIELGGRKCTENERRLILDAFEKITAKRRNQAAMLAASLDVCRECLPDIAEEAGDE